jgi:DNA polymerase elongation subunit (family B)
MVKVTHNSIQSIQSISGKDFLTLSPDEQRRYSLEDSKLVMELSKHNNFEVLDAMYGISEIIGHEFERVCRTNLTTWWGILFDQIIEQGRGDYTKPSKKFAEGRELQKQKQKQEEYKGGLVLEPKKGFYHNIVVVDAASLYPSVAINYNLSFDTLNCQCCKDNPNTKMTLDSEFLKDCKSIHADDDNNTNNNCWICQKADGIFPSKLKVFRKERLEQKRLGNETKQR